MCRPGRQLVPGARIGIAHGKMTEEQISSVWQQLLDNEIDILVCTTLIETGVDVRNCNTLIIENADRMGLSQLLPDTRPRGAFFPQGVCVFHLYARQGADRGRRQAAFRHPGVYLLRLRVPHRHA